MASGVYRGKIAVCFSTLSVLVLVMGMFAALFGQVAGGSFSGTVTDPTGGVVPNAEISIRNVATGVISTTTANADGFYRVPNLVPGNYEISASKAGFSQATATATLTVGNAQVVNLVMQVGKTTQKVEVTGAAPTVELASSTLSGTVEENRVVELPLNGRDWTQLATLHPAVASISAQQPLGVSAPRGVRGYGNSMTISGTRPQENNYRLDGLSTNDYSNGAPGSVLGVNLGVDAVQEFSVLTSNYDASYGRTSGGVINAITKSGTNTLHGNLYEFMRNDNLDGRNFFEPNIGHFVRNQFGGSAGGPIRKDKTFIFGDYEGLRQSQELPQVSSVPSQAAHTGNLCSGSVTVDANVMPFLAFYPLPNTAPIPGPPGSPSCSDAGTFTFDSRAATTENYVIVRGDEHFNEKDSLSGTWLYDKANFAQPDAFNDWLIGNKTFRELIAVQESHVFSPSMANAIRIGYSRVIGTVSTPLGAINPVAADTSLGVFGGHAAPQIAIGGLTTTAGGLNALPFFEFTWNSYQLYDDAFITRGHHSIKIGFANENMQENQLGDLQPTGFWTFPSLSQFLQNNETGGSFIGTLPGALFPRGQRARLFGGYIQDDWRFRSNLTLNLGLRYEMLTNPYAVHGKTINLDVVTAVTPRTGGNYFHDNPTLHNFEPRVGFAWDPWKHGKTSIRGSFGVFDVLPLLSDFQQMINLAAPFYVFGTVAFGSPTPAPTGFFNKGVGSLAQAQVAAGNNTSLQTMFVEPSPPRNYVMTWNINVQQQLTGNTSVEVGYVGSHGVHMANREDDMNSVIPVATSQGLLFPSPVGTGTKLNPNWGSIRGIYWAGDSFYDALEAQVTKRISHGFQVQGSYTWGKTIDTGSASIIGDPFQNSISSPYFFCKKCRRGPADFDIRNNFVVNYLWDPPAPKTELRGVQWALGGWEVGGIVTAQSGTPTTPTISGDSLGLLNTDPYAFPVRLTGPGCASGTTGDIHNWFNPNCFAYPNPPNLLMNRAGRNSIFGPKLVNFDFSLYKNNYIKRISEDFNIQFRAEFFNVLNHPSFLPPLNAVGNNQVFLQGAAGNLACPASATQPTCGGVNSFGGAITGTSTQPRQIQLAVKVIW